MRCLLLPLLGALGLAACDEYPLRGEGMPSADGLTYLIVADNGGADCGAIKVDRKTWPHGVGEPGRIAPGQHEIDCGGAVPFHVPKGEIFRFNYWGP